MKGKVRKLEMKTDIWFDWMVCILMLSEWVCRFCVRVWMCVCTCVIASVCVCRLTVYPSFSVVSVQMLWELRRSQANILSFWLWQVMFCFCLHVSLCVCLTRFGNSRTAEYTLHLFSMCNCWLAYCLLYPPTRICVYESEYVPVISSLRKPTFHSTLFYLKLHYSVNEWKSRGE